MKKNKPEKPLKKPKANPLPWLQQWLKTPQMPVSELPEVNKNKGVDNESKQ